MPENPHAPEDTVRLKPLFGIRPGQYLAALYGLAILAILFFTLAFPGLARPGSAALVRCEPEGAAFYVDGVYMGEAPCRVFVPKGVHTVELSLPGFVPVVRDVEFPGRLFSVTPVDAVLTTGGDGLGGRLDAFAGGAAEYAAWTFAGEPTAAYQVPMSLSEGAYRAALPGERALRDGMNGVIEAAARFAVTRAALRDLARAKVLADNGGLAPSPVSVLRSAEETIAWLSAHPEAARWLSRTLPADLQGGAWFSKAGEPPTGGREAPTGGREPPTGGTEAPTGGREAPTGGREAPARITVRSLPFVRVRSPVSGMSGFFWIAETAVPASLLEDFRRETGRDAGAVSEGIPGAGPAVGVSWHEAASFCDWLAASLPPGMEGWVSRLPAGAEWEACGFVPAEGLWEWGGDPFAPLDFLPAPPAAIQAVGSPERVLWGVPSASLPPDIPSPRVSFRPVLAPKERE
jgi:hypothetical protein